MKKEIIKNVGAGLVSDQKGITLIALIITIILILILASITVNVAINGDLFDYAKNAKDSTEIANEKETIQKAVILAESSSKTGRITKEIMQKSIDSLTNENNAKVYDLDEDFVIIFETKRAYTIDSKGKIINMAENYENPNRKLLGQLSDSSYGTETKPYEINCIEDLVDLSFQVNGIEVLEDGTIDWLNNGNFFDGKNFILNRNLSFASELSYENASRTDYGDINRNGKLEDLLTEITTGIGWIPIGDAIKAYGVFCGSFNGNGKIISDIYIYNIEQTALSGLFGQSKGGKIINLTVSGNIYCNSNKAGGILGECTSTYEIENCCFKGKIENIYTEGITGGIIGYDRFNNVNITNSYNEATVTSAYYAGGIIGRGGNLFSNCYNTGAITGGQRVGGIVGYSPTLVENCYNTGKIISLGNEAGGIIGTIYAGSNKKIYRCYNSGNINGENYIGGILGYNYSSPYLTVEQCYNTGDITGTNNVSGIVGCISGSYSKILNCYNMGNLTGTTVGGIGRCFSSVARANAIAVSCYNKGVVNATTKSGVQDGTTYNSYYLSSCGATDTIATSVGEDELKSSASILDKSFTINEEDNAVTISEEEFQNVWTSDEDKQNDGYPVLRWQSE